MLQISIKSLKIGKKHKIIVTFLSLFFDLSNKRPIFAVQTYIDATSQRPIKT